MTPSKRYKQLRRNVKKLRHALLPGKFSPTGEYRSADRVHLRTVAFRLLAHAEIESFIEERALELLNIAWSAWEEKGVPSRVILGLLAFSEIATSKPPSKLGGDPYNQRTYDDLNEPLKKAQNAWRWVYKQNHGIKEENILGLLLPLGIMPHSFDGVLLGDLTSFGDERGEAAHSSVVKIKQFADPQIEYKRVSQLVDNLRTLDEVISQAEEAVRELSSALSS